MVDRRGCGLVRLADDVSAAEANGKMRVAGLRECAEQKRKWELVLTRAMSHVFSSHSPDRANEILRWSEARWSVFHISRLGRVIV